MMLIVAATAATGFLASAWLLGLGMKLIWFRYVLAASVAYVSFFVFVWIWLRWEELEPELDLQDASDVVGEIHGGFGTEIFHGTSDSSSAALDIDAEGCLVAILLVAALTIFALGAGHMVLTAPAFLAEVLLDGTLSYGLYRRVRDLDRRHWLEPAIERSIVPFASILAAVVVAGLAMNEYVPTADSIGDVLTRLTAR